MVPNNAAVGGFAECDVALFIMSGSSIKEEEEEHQAAAAAAAASSGGGGGGKLRACAAAAADPLLTAHSPSTRKSMSSSANFTAHDM